MKCQACQHQNGDGARFCTQCGAGLDLVCASCGGRVGSAHRFCQGCGARLASADQIRPAGAPSANRPGPDVSDVSAAAPAGERREVTVLFGDLTGFTGLSGTLDPEETHALLNRYFETVDGVVQSYGGTIDKHIGDGIMAVFGAPVAHSDDPERACRAATDIHAALSGMVPPLRAHIGIASGTVVASQTGSSQHREYTVIGDSVNLAARLQAQAGPGETLISGAVHRQASPRLECEPLDRMTLKGIAGATEVWRLEGIATGEASHDAQPFVGRAQQLAQFAGALSSCQATGFGQALLVRGEPGIGKTRLLRQFRKAAEELSFGWQGGLVLDFGSGRGADAIATVICGLLGVSAGAGADEKLEAIERVTGDGVIGEAHRPFLIDLLSLPQPPELRSLYHAMDEATRARGKQQILKQLAMRAAASRAMVVAIEDVHWADGQTLSLLAHLACASAEAPILLVMTSRIEGDPIDAAWRAAAEGATLTTVDLGPLRPAEATALASRYFNAGESLAKACIERSGGNPLFLEHLLLGAEEAYGNAVPGSVQSIVLSRVDSLELQDRQALQAASVLGQRFALDALRHVSDDSGYDCRNLVERLLVRPEGDDFLFAHALVRDGVYSSLLKPRRVELHRRAADWHSNSDLPLYAEHLDRAGDPGAAAAFLTAAQEEAQNDRNEAALRLTNRSLEIADRTEISAVAAFRGDLLRSLGEVESSIAAFEQARDCASDAIEESRSWIGLAEGLRFCDRHDDALSALQNADRVIDADHPLLKAEIHHLRGNLYFPAGRVADCLAQHELALGYARQAGSREWEARARGGLGDASYLAGRMRTACENFRQCVRLCDEQALGRVAVANRSMVGWTRMYLNEVVEACADGLAAAEMAEKVGQNRAEMLGRLVAGFMFIEQGQLDSARAQVDLGLGLARRLGARHFIAEALCFRTMIFMAEGRPAEATATVGEAIGILRGAGMTFFGPTALGLAARLAEDEGERRSHLSEAEDILSSGCVSHNYFWFYREAIEVALNARQWDEACRYCDALEAYAAPEPLPWVDLFVERGRMLSRTGRGDRGGAVSEDLETIAKRLECAGFIQYLPAVRSAL